MRSNAGACPLSFPDAPCKIESKNVNFTVKASLFLKSMLVDKSSELMKHVCTAEQTGRRIGQMGKA